MPPYLCILDIWLTFLLMVLLSCLYNGHMYAVVTSYCYCERASRPRHPQIFCCRLHRCFHIYVLVSTLGSQVFVIQNPLFFLCFVQQAVLRCIMPPSGGSVARHALTTCTELSWYKISLYALLRLRKLLIETENKPKINLCCTFYY